MRKRVGPARQASSLRKRDAFKSIKPDMAGTSRNNQSKPVPHSRCPTAHSFKLFLLNGISVLRKFHICKRANVAPILAVRSSIPHFFFICIEPANEQC